MTIGLYNNILFFLLQSLQGGIERQRTKQIKQKERKKREEPLPT